MNPITKARLKLIKHSGCEIFLVLSEAFKRTKKNKRNKLSPRGFLWTKLLEQEINNIEHAIFPEPHHWRSNSLHSVGNSWASHESSYIIERAIHRDNWRRRKENTVQFIAKWSNEFQFICCHRSESADGLLIYGRLKKLEVIMTGQYLCCPQVNKGKFLSSCSWII